MNSRRYAVLGWVVWQFATRMAKRKAGQNKAKLGAGAAAALVVVGGILVAAAETNKDGR